MEDWFVEPDMRKDHFALSGKVRYVDEVLRDSNSDKACQMYPNAHPAADLMDGPNDIEHPVGDCENHLHAVTVLGEGAAGHGAEEW
jgi:hypothetical protein